MKKLLFALLAVTVSPPLFAQASGTITSSQLVCIGVSADHSTVGVEVTGTWTGTLQPQVAIQGQALTNSQVVPSTSTTAASTITANGVYYANVGSASQFCILGNTVASGSAVVFLNAAKGVNASTLGGGGAGSGTVTNSGNLVNNNLLLGAGATSVKDYGSSVLAPANGGVALSNTAGLGGEFVSLDMDWGQVSAGTVQLVSAANKVDAFQFVQKYTQTFTRMATRVRTTFGASSHVGLAIYDSTGTLVPNATTGALDGTNTGGAQVVTVTAVTLTPGIYYIGISTDGASATSGRLDNITPAVSMGEFTQYTNTAQGNRVVTGATASVGGVPPATLGALSSNVTSVGIPLLWIEP